APVTIATLPLRSGIPGSLFVRAVPVEIVRARDAQPLRDVGLHARESSRGDVASADARGELTLLLVVLGGQFRQLPPDDAERVQRDEHPEARTVVVARGEDLAGEELLDCLDELLSGRTLAHVTPCLSSRSQISYSTS